MIVVMKEPSMERYQTAQTKETSLVTISAVTFVERQDQAGTKQVCVTKTFSSRLNPYEEFR